MISTANINDSDNINLSKKPSWLPLFIGLLFAGLLFLFIADRLFHPEKFQITEIVVHGQFKKVDGAQIKKVVQQGIDGNYFSVGLQRLEREIEQLPWVFSASLRRKWPSTIVVDVEEVEPVARWGEDSWLNFTGDLVSKQIDHDIDHGVDHDISSAGLPLLSGPRASIHIVWKEFQRWSGRFASNGLSLKELSLDSRGLLNFQLSLGALSLNSDQYQQSVLEGEIKLGAVNMVVELAHSKTRIERFISALDQQLIIQFPQMKTIDLRYPNGFAISWRESGPSSEVLAESLAEVLTHPNDDNRIE